MAVNVDNIKAQMRKGILEYCILSIISRGDSYASAIISELKAAEMIVVEGTLYPILTRPEKPRFALLPLGRVSSGPPRKLLHHHRPGREYLAALDVHGRNFRHANRNEPQRIGNR